MSQRCCFAVIVLLALGPAAGLAGTGQIENFNVIDKPNDNGSAIVLTWKRMPDEGPDVIYEVRMADPELKARLLKKLDKLVELKVIDRGRRDELAAELATHEQDGKLFWSQGKWVSNRPREERSAIPLCPLKSDLPASFGYPADHRETPDRTCPCSACQEHGLELSKFTRGELVLHVNVLTHDKLVKAVRSAKVDDERVAEVENDDDPARQDVEIKMVSKAIGRSGQYFFRIDTVRAGRTVAQSPAADAAAESEWFAWHRLNVLLAMVVLSAIIMTFAWIAKRNPNKLFIRRIGGLEAVDDALGRAAEMGKPVFFCHGPGGLGEVVTISAINLLGKVAERVAEYGTELKVTCLDYMVMQVSQEMVRDAYIRVGRPDAYRDENVFFVSGNTFAYSAAVGGMMIREKAGTAFFFGRFGSESLLLSETGAITKAIQIAGTDSFTQIPFFITTCDYTLIGEEMYAGSAYLSREPRLVGAVKGQDAIKAITMSLIILGAGLASAGVWWFARMFWSLT